MLKTDNYTLYRGNDKPTTYKTRSGRTVKAPSRYVEFWACPPKNVDHEEAKKAFAEVEVPVSDDPEWNEDDFETETDEDWAEEELEEIPEGDESELDIDEPEDDVLTDGDYESDEEPIWIKKSANKQRQVQKQPVYIEFDESKPIKNIRVEYFDNKLKKISEYTYKDDNYRPYAHLLVGETRCYTRKFDPSVMNTKKTHILDYEGGKNKLDRVYLTIQYKDGNQTQYQYQALDPKQRYPKNFFPKN
jgi:hypothetical protein